MRDRQSVSTTWPLVEYLVFAAPYWIVPLMSVIGFFWLAGNRSQWGTFPFAIAFFACTLGGLGALTRVLGRRLKGDPFIGAGTALLLFLGLCACASPLAHLIFVKIPSSTYPVERETIVFQLYFLWPSPVYLHWLIGGLRAARR